MKSIVLKSIFNIIKVRKQIGENMDWMNDDAENKRIYEHSLHPDGIKKTIKMNELAGKKLNVVPNVFSINKEKTKKETNDMSESKFVNIMAMIIILIVFIVTFFMR